MLLRVAALMIGLGEGLVVDDRPGQVGQKWALGGSIPKGRLQASRLPWTCSSSHTQATACQGPAEPREQRATADSAPVGRTPPVLESGQTPEKS